MPEKILTESVVAATVIANFVSVDVGTALQLSRIRSLILGLDCDGRKAAPALDRTSHPTNMTIGSDPLFREHTGALASNSMIMCAVFVGHGGVAAGYGLKKGISWSEAASKLEFPSKSITIVLYFFQPMVTSGLYLTVYAQDLGGRVAGIATLVVAACIIGGVALLTLGQMFSAVYIVFDDNESDDVKPAPGAARRLLGYITKADGKWEDKPGTKPGFCKKFGMFFKDYVGEHPGFLLVELCFSMLLAALDCQKIVSTEHCQALNGLLLVIMIAQLAYMVKLRPVAKPLSRHLFIVSTSFQTLSALVSFIKSLLNDGSGTSEVLDTIAMIAILLSSLVYMLKTFLSCVLKITTFKKWLDKKSSKAKNFEADGKLSDGAVAEGQAEQLAEEMVSLAVPWVDPLEEERQRAALTRGVNTIEEAENDEEREQKDKEWIKNSISPPRVQAPRFPGGGVRHRSNAVVGNQPVHEDVWPARVPPKVCSISNVHPQTASPLQRKPLPPLPPFRPPPYAATMRAPQSQTYDPQPVAVADSPWMPARRNQPGPPTKGDRSFPL